MPSLLRLSLMSFLLGWVFFNPTSLPTETNVGIVEVVEYDDTPWYKTNILCLLLTLAILGCFGFFVYAQWFSNDDSIKLASRITLGILGGLYYMEALFFSGTPRYLWNQTDPEGIDVYVERVKRSAPEIGFHVECYHHETRHRTVRDSNGNTRTESYTVKVTTYRGSDVLHYSSWDDVSGVLAGVGEEYRMTRCRFSKNYIFADERSRDEYEHQWSHFKNSHRHRDTHMDTWITFHVNGYTGRKLAIVGENDVHCCVHLAWYLLSTLLVGSYIYRSWFQNISIKQSFEFMKRIKI